MSVKINQWVAHQHGKGLTVLPEGVFVDDIEEGMYRIWFQTSETKTWEFYTMDQNEAESQFRVKKEEYSDSAIRMEIRQKDGWKTVSQFKGSE